MIVTSFAIVLAGSFLVLAPVATGANDVMLTVFTTAAGFLAGLLSPSPLSEGVDPGAEQAHALPGASGR